MKTLEHQGHHQQKKTSRQPLRHIVIELGRRLSQDVDDCFGRFEFRLLGRCTPSGLSIVVSCACQSHLAYRTTGQLLCRRGADLAEKYGAERRNVNFIRWPPTSWTSLISMHGKSLAKLSRLGVRTYPRYSSTSLQATDKLTNATRNREDPSIILNIQLALFLCYHLALLWW